MKRFFKKAFGWATQAHRAMPFVRLAVAILPIPGDSEVLALCEKFFVKPMDWYLAIPEEHRQEIVIRDIVRRAIQKKYPEMKDSEINLAIEASVAAMKTKSKEAKNVS